LPVLVEEDVVGDLLLVAAVTLVRDADVGGSGARRELDVVVVEADVALPRAAAAVDQKGGRLEALTGEVRVADAAGALGGAEKRPGGVDGVVVAVDDVGRATVAEHDLGRAVGRAPVAQTRAGDRKVRVREV